MQKTLARPTRLAMATAGLALLAACNGNGFDFDLRDLGNGFDTTSALANVEPRPEPDDRGVISYPNYQVVVAKQGDTARSIATRLGLNADTLASYNGIEPDVTLRRDEVIALPSRVAEPSPATGAATSGPIQPSTVEVTTLAGNAIERAGTTAAAPATEPAQTVIGAEPVQHQVLRGETLFSIARLYGASPQSIAEWNGLGPDLNVRAGQFLLIPAAGAVPPAAREDTAAPGEGSVTPVPPSAETPLPPADTVAAPAATPEPAPVPVPDLGSEQTETASSAPMVFPAQGSIIRAYAAGRNDGIDIGASAGSPVVAAASGSVAAITTDTAGIQIVVIRHAGNLLTVYTHLDNLTVSRGDTVSQGQAIGSVQAGDPSFLHFEVRRGTASEDPTNFLP